MGANRQVDRRKYCEGVCSEEYISTGVPVQERLERERMRDNAIRSRILIEELEEELREKGELDG